MVDAEIVSLFEKSRGMQSNRKLWVLLKAARKARLDINVTSSAKRYLMAEKIS